jgi:hypothetical protein
MSLEPELNFFYVTDEPKDWHNQLYICPNHNIHVGTWNITTEKKIAENDTANMQNSDYHCLCIALKCA